MFRERCHVLDVGALAVDLRMRKWRLNSGAKPGRPAVVNSGVMSMIGAPPSPFPTTSKALITSGERNRLDPALQAGESPAQLS